MNRPSQLISFSVSLLFLSFFENRLWGLVESALIDIQEIVLNWVAFLLNIPMN